VLPSKSGCHLLFRLPKSSFGRVKCWFGLPPSSFGILYMGHVEKLVRSLQHLLWQGTLKSDSKSNRASLLPMSAVVWLWVMFQLTSMACILAMHAIAFESACTCFMFQLRRVSSVHHECSICLDTSKDEGGVAERPQWITCCGHVYHVECLHQWLQLQTNCPTCRRDLRALRWRWFVYQVCWYTCKSLEQYGNRYLYT
jgi:hypothetical protein